MITQQLVCLSYILDWVHDYVKERVRLRKLGNIPGWRGKLSRFLDGGKAWVLVTLIGICAGCLAGSITLGTELLTNLKEGYCTKNFLHNRGLCCLNSKSTFNFNIRE